MAKSGEKTLNISIAEQAYSDIEAIRDSIAEKLMGIKPSRADVIRQVLQRGLISFAAELEGKESVPAAVSA